MTGGRQRNRSTSGNYQNNKGTARTAQQGGAVPRRRNNSTHQDHPGLDPLPRPTTAPPGVYHGTNVNYNPHHVGYGASAYYAQPSYPGYPQNGQPPHYNMPHVNSAQQPQGAHPPFQHRYPTRFAPPSNRPPSTSNADPSSTVTVGVGHITMSLEQFQEFSRGKSKPHKKHGEHRNSKKTVWYSHLEGDVETAEICVFSIANACKFNDSGCKALHAKCPQHWQFRKNAHWYNFREFHSKELEEAFQKAECDGTQLSQLDPDKLRRDKSFAGLEKLLGDQIWTADFDKMVIKDSSECLDIRRISTRSSVLSNSKMATVYEWYFQDEKDNWIKYGQPNSANKVDCIPDITPDDIEKQFIKEKVPTFDFKSELHEYVIDFSKMTQTNKVTKTSRPIRRRTKVRPMKGSFKPRQAVGGDAVPSYWAATTSTDIYELFELQPSETEFQRYQKLMRETLKNCVIVKMQRIQNPYLWNAYENKKKFIEKKVKSSNLNERYLFHGTDAGNVSSICEQNLDWRLHGSNVGQLYGRGSYFTSSATYSDHYSRCSPDGSKVLLIVKVIVGTVTLGNCQMARPPLNRATGNLYDSTVNNVGNPTVFVKYDNQEYYPEYIVYYR